MRMKKILVLCSAFVLTACSSSSIDINQMVEDVKANYYEDSMIEVDASLARDLLFLEDENSVCIGLTSSSSEVSELMVCQKSDEAMEKLEQRIQYYQDSAARYTPEDVAMIEKSQLFEISDVSVLVIGENAETIAKYIQENYKS